MSLAGRPKTIARKARAETEAKARAAYKEAVQPIEDALRQILAEQIAPHRARLAAEIRKADIAYFEAIGDEQSAALLKEAA